MLLQEYPQVRDLDDAAKYVDRLLDEERVADDDYSNISGRITAEIQKERETLIHCRTAQLWLMYMRMVQIVCMFIKAERTGD